MTRPADMSKEKLGRLSDQELEALKLQYNSVKAEYRSHQDGWKWATKDISVVEDEIMRRSVA